VEIIEIDNVVREHHTVERERLCISHSNSKLYLLTPFGSAGTEIPIVDVPLAGRHLGKAEWRLGGKARVIFLHA
jgi:hypothetical protein